MANVFSEIDSFMTETTELLQNSRANRYSYQVNKCPINSASYSELLKTTQSHETADKISHIRERLQRDGKHVERKDIAILFHSEVNPDLFDFTPNPAFASQYQPPTFDGHSNWYEFRQSFELFVNKYSYDPCWDRKYLHMSLKDEPADFVRTLPDTYRELPLDYTLRALEERYGSVYGQLSSARQREGERHVDWSERVWKLTQKAYPFPAPTWFLHEQAAFFFTRGLSDNQAFQYVWPKVPKNIAEAVSLLQQFYSQPAASPKQIPIMDKDHFLSEKVIRIEQLLESMVEENKKITDQLENIKKENDLLVKTLAATKEEQTSLRVEFNQFQEDIWRFLDLLMKPHPPCPSLNDPPVPNTQGEDTVTGKHNVSLCFECEEPQHLEAHCPAQKERKTSASSHQQPKD